MQEHKSNARDALSDETSTPKRARLVDKSSVTKKSDHGNAVLTSGARQTRASTADQLQKQTKSTAKPVGKTTKTRESVVENVKIIEEIRKESEVTPTLRFSSAKKVTIRVDGKTVASGRWQIVASINDGVDYVQPNFKTAAERERPTDHEIGQDTDHGEEREEEKEKTSKLALPKKTKIASVVDQNVLREIALRDIEERDLTEAGDGGDSDEEGLEIDFHSKAVRPRVKLGVPNEESDTDNLDVEWIDDLIGEAWWHMRAPGAQIPGSPDSWMPPKGPDNWGGYVPKIG